VRRYRQSEGSGTSWVGRACTVFHNGAPATSADVVEFYNQRFDIGFTDQQKADLVAFLSSL
jgi:hypothetical protein